MNTFDFSDFLSHVVPTTAWLSGSLLLPVVLFLVLSSYSDAHAVRYIGFVCLSWLVAVVLLLFLEALDSSSFIEEVSTPYLKVLLKVALPEELYKLFGFFLAVLLSLKKGNDTRSPLIRQKEAALGFVAGFVLLENIIYIKGFLLSAMPLSELLFAILNRNLCAGTLHVATMILLLTSLHVQKQRRWLCGMILLNVLYHAAFNTLADLDVHDIVFYVMGISFLIFSLVLTRRISKNETSAASPES